MGDPEAAVRGGRLKGAGLQGRTNSPGDRGGPSGGEITHKRFRGFNPVTIVGGSRKKEDGGGRGRRSRNSILKECF